MCDLLPRPDLDWRQHFEVAVVRLTMMFHVADDYIDDDDDYDYDDDDNDDDH